MGLHKLLIFLNQFLLHLINHQLSDDLRFVRTSIRCNEICLLAIWHICHTIIFKRGEQSW